MNTTDNQRQLTIEEKVMDLTDETRQRLINSKMEMIQSLEYIIQSAKNELDILKDSSSIGKKHISRVEIVRIANAASQLTIQSAEWNAINESYKAELLLQDSPFVNQ